MQRLSLQPQRALAALMPWRQFAAGLAVVWTVGPLPHWPQTSAPRG